MAEPTYFLQLDKLRVPKTSSGAVQPLNFPVSVGKIPSLRNIFPVNLRRELHKMSLRHSSFLLQDRLLRPQDCKIPCKIPC